MLKSELHELEKSVGGFIVKWSTENTDVYQQEIAEQVAYTKRLCSELKKKWTHELLSSAKDPVIKRYIEYHEAGIVLLSDKVSHYIPASNVHENSKAIKIDAIKLLSIELESVLEFLQKHFYQYFDIDHKATIYRCQQLNVRVAEYRSRIAAYQGISVERSLIDVILISIDEVAEEALFARISFRQVDHLFNLMQMVEQLLLTDPKVTTASLLRMLYQNNFNSFHFYYWYQEYTLGKVAAITDRKEKQQFFREQVIFFGGIFVSPEKALQPELPSTDVYLTNWLQEQAGDGARRPNLKPIPDQFPLNLSVPQFALFVRIFHKSGCFPVENVARITRFFSRNFTTKKQDHISHKSFGRAFYNLDQSAAAVVRDYLQKMLNYLNKTYFP